MKILVTAKRVTDPDVKIKVKPDGSGIATEGIDYKVNPFDEIAIEEAIRIKEKNKAEVVVASIGSKDATKEIRSGLAMGADRGILVLTEDFLDANGVAKVLKALVEKEQPDLVLLGKQAVDGDNNQAGQMLAELMDWPQACFASAVELVEDDKKAKVTREVDGGFDHVELDLPAVITADLRLNEPRYASLPGIMKAKKKKIDQMELGELGVDTELKVVWHEFATPPERQAGEMVPDVPTLVTKLRDEAKVI